MAIAASKFESLELKGVGRSFGGVDALVDLNLTVRAGEFIALLGPSVPVQGGNTTTATVSVVEYHGREFAVGVLTPGGRALHVRSDHAPMVGSVVELTADPNRVLVFRADIIDPSTLSVEERELLEVRT